MERTVIRNAIVLSMDPTIGEQLDADVLIDDEKIAAVQPNIGPVDGHEIDGKDMIVMPGFVDTHRQTGKAFCATPPPTGALLNISVAFAASWANSTRQTTCISRTISVRLRRWTRA